MGDRVGLSITQAPPLRGSPFVGAETLFRNRSLRQLLVLCFRQLLPSTPQDVTHGSEFRAALGTLDDGFG